MHSSVSSYTRYSRLLNFRRRQTVGAHFQPRMPYVLCTCACMRVPPDDRNQTLAFGASWLLGLVRRGIQETSGVLWSWVSFGWGSVRFGWVKLGLVWYVLIGLGWVGFGLVWLGWVGLGWVGLGWVGLGWVGLGWVGPGVSCFPPKHRTQLATFTKSPPG